MSHLALAQAFTSLATMLDVGMALDQALVLLAENHKNVWHRAMWFTVTEHIQQGLRCDGSFVCVGDTQYSKHV